MRIVSSNLATISILLFVGGAYAAELGDAPSCHTVRPDELTTVTQFVRQRERVSETAPMVVSVDDIDTRCWIRLNSWLTTAPLQTLTTWFLSPDHQYLTRELMSVATNPQRELAQRRSAVWQKIMARATPSARAKPVTLIVFEDLQCPTCKEAHTAVGRLAATGKIDVISVTLPARQHDWALRAAVFVKCAGFQSEVASEAVRNVLFQDQSAITSNSLDAYAKRALDGVKGIDRDALMGCLRTHKGELAVARDLQLAKEADIRQTPTFVFNGQWLPAGIPIVDVIELLNGQFDTTGSGR
jgi:protein-disulfide isomerase